MSRTPDDAAPRASVGPDARRSRPSRTTPLAALVVASLTVLTGCGMWSDAGTSPLDPTTASAEPTPTASPGGSTAAPTADAVRTGGVPVTVGGTTVLHVLADAASGTTVTARADAADGGVTVLTVAPPDGSAPVDVLVAAPAGTTLALQDDGSLAVLGADGTFVGGSGRPVTGPDATPSGFTRAGDDLARLTVSGGTATARIGTQALLGTDWGEREGGRSLAVEPSSWARSAGLAGELGTWLQVVASVPEADTPGMRDQLTCHVIGAPDKATWNLEPWRPDAGLLAVLAAGCNPT